MKTRLGCCGRSGNVSRGLAGRAKGLGLPGGMTGGCLKGERTCLHDLPRTANHSLLPTIQAF